MQVCIFAKENSIYHKSLIYPEGVSSANFLNKLLKEDLELNPAS